MNDRNTEQQIRYLEEVCTCLHRAGFETQPLENSQMPVYRSMKTRSWGIIPPSPP